MKTFPSEAKGIFSYVYAYRKELLPGFCFALLRTIVIAPFPWLFRIIIDVHLKAANVFGIISIGLVFIGLLAFHYVFAVEGMRRISGVVASMSTEFRSRIFNKLQFLNFGYLDQQKTGKLLSKYAFDTQKLEIALIQFLNQFFPQILYSFTILTLLIIIDWQLSLIILLMVPVYGFVHLHFFNRIKVSHNQARLAHEHLTGTANELISALRLVRSFGEERQAESQLDQSSFGLAQSRVRMHSLSAVFGTFVHVSTQTLSLVIIGGGAILVLHNNLTIGTLFAFLVALPIILMPVQMIGQMSEQYFVGQESYQSIKELLDSTYVEDWVGNVQHPNLRGDIRFEEVSMTYGDADKMVIRDFSLHIRAGEHIAFVGPSGSGKSTLASLVLGLYKPTKGHVYIDGVRQQDMDMRWFRQQVAVVMQESLLLSGSVIENIRFARHDASEEEVRAAVRMANAEDFILRLPEGYNTPLGERGVNLSGGQRQRISIARAILRNPRVLILDEATSALDYESEHQIQEALERLAHGRTVITIAHRLSTIKNADRIIMLREGVVVEQGSFQELIAREGFFTQLLASGEAAARVR
jgi:ABC-type multidrug transport system fused ATPase/permease subunit